eukprot:PhF_6_TR43096/c0_g1_i1/m.65828/K10858/PMS2; DNA mismatch repair protein PMS2
MKRSINRVEDSTSKAICSAQVIPSLWSAAKELIENSIDAGATFADILLSEHGIERLEVRDDGQGMSLERLQGFGVLNVTSKVASFEDVQRVKSLGFRGEAVAALCAVSQEVRILSKQRGSQPVLVVYQKGNLVSTGSDAFEGEHGTSISVLHLFDALPVRRKHLMSNAKKEFSSTIIGLQQYCFLSSLPATSKRCRVRIAHNGTIITSSQSGGKLIDAVVCIAGVKTAKGMKDVDWTFSLPAKVTSDEPITVHITGVLGSVSASTSIQHFYLDGRPVDFPKIHKVLSAACADKGHVAYVLNVCHSGGYDVNMTSDKRVVVLESEDQLLIEIHKEVNVFFTQALHDTQRTNAVSSKLVMNASPLAAMEKCSYTPNRSASNFSANSVATPKREIPLTPSKTTPTPADFEKEQTPQKEETLLFDVEDNADEIVTGIQEVYMTPKQEHPKLVEETSPAPPALPQSFSTRTPFKTPKPPEATTKPDEDLFLTPVIKKGDDCCGDPTTTPCRHVSPTSNDDILVDTEDLLEHTIPTTIYEYDQSDEERGISGVNGLEVSVDFDDMFPSENVESSNDTPTTTSTSITVHDVTKANISYILNISDFCNMRVIGQFNLGFIVTEFRGDLFIIDQHAADEKRNFEDLVTSAKTNIHPQSTLRPLLLGAHLTARSEEIISLRTTLKAHGMHFAVREEDHQLRIVSVPSTAGTAYTSEDVEEVLTALLDCPDKESIILPQRVRHMLASRACRKSIMIGDPLDVPTMVSVVNRLTGLEQPWN